LWHPQHVCYKIDLNTSKGIANKKWLGNTGIVNWTAISYKLFLNKCSTKWIFVTKTWIMWWGVVEIQIIHYHTLSWHSSFICTCSSTQNSSTWPLVRKEQLDRKMVEWKSDRFENNYSKQVIQKWCHTIWGYFGSPFPPGKCCS